MASITGPHSADHNHAGNEADKALAAIADGHGHDWNVYGPNFRRACTCGRSFTTPNGLGLHLGAIDRKAWKAWDATYTAALEAFRAGQAAK